MTVSVIIPSHNRAGFLEAAIRSVQAQPWRDVEIIVADDGSTDETPDLIARLGGVHHYLRLPHRGLPASARNAGLRVATGNLVAFLDSDDLYLPDKLSLQIPALESHPDVGFVYSDALFFTSSPEQPKGRVLDGLPSPSGHIFADLLRGNFLSPATVLIRSECVEAVGLFDEDRDLAAVEDYEMWLRLAARYPAVFVPGMVAAIRRHPGSLSRDRVMLNERRLRVLGKMESLFPDLLGQNPAALHEAYARGHGALATGELRRGHLLASASHGIRAFRRTLRLPGLGLSALFEWRRRRRARRPV